MKRMIFHYPKTLNNFLKRGSAIRPLKMLQAFKNIGYEVDLVVGNWSERKESILSIKKK